MMRNLMIMCGICIMSEGLAATYSVNWVQKVEDYFKNLDSIEAEFTQNGSMTGKLWVKKPVLRFSIGNMTVVAQRKKITLYNSKLNEKTENQKNPYSTLLQKKFKLDEVVTVQRIHKEGNELRVTVKPKSFDSEIVLLFNIKNNDISLKGWKIRMKGRNDIDINLVNITTLRYNKEDLLDCTKNI